MGSLVGHVVPGFGFLLIGLWHLFNHTKLHTLKPNSYTSPIWFSFHSPYLRYLEPALIAAGSCVSIAMELFVGPRHHQPLDDDWTIPSSHLHNFDHASISLSILIYAISVIILDRNPHSLPGLLQLIATTAFFQEFLLFHVHSTDHTGVEGQFHWLLQIVIAVSFFTTVLGIWRPRSFMLAFVRSASIAFQGVWFIVIGYALWTPSLIPKGCFMTLEDGRLTVRCRDAGSLERAKALANLEFCWFVSGMVVFCEIFYLVVAKWYGDKDYAFVLEEEDDSEAQKMKA